MDEEELKEKWHLQAADERVVEDAAERVVDVEAPLLLASTSLRMKRDRVAAILLANHAKGQKANNVNSKIVAQFLHVLRVWRDGARKGVDYENVEDHRQGVDENVKNHRQGVDVDANVEAVDLEEDDEEEENVVEAIIASNDHDKVVGFNNPNDRAHSHFMPFFPKRPIQIKFPYLETFNISNPKCARLDMGKDSSATDWLWSLDQQLCVVQSNSSTAVWCGCNVAEGFFVAVTDMFDVHWSKAEIKNMLVQVGGGVLFVCLFVCLFVY